MSSLALASDGLLDEGRPLSIATRGLIDTDGVAPPDPPKRRVEKIVMAKSPGRGMSM